MMANHEFFAVAFFLVVSLQQGKLRVFFDFDFKMDRNNRPCDVHFHFNFSSICDTVLAVQ